MAEEITDQEYEQRMLASLRQGLVDLKAAREAVAPHRQSDQKHIRDAVHYIVIAYQIHEDFNRQVIRMLPRPDFDPDGPAGEGVMEDLQTSLGIFKDASKLVRYAMLHARGLEGDATIERFASTRAQRQDLLNRIHRRFGPDPYKFYQIGQDNLDYQAAAFLQLLHDARFRCADDD